MGDRLRIGRVLREPLFLAAVAGVVVIAAVAVIRGGDDGPPAVSGTPKEAVDTVEAFRRALAARDFATICDQLYTTEAREAAGGDDCQSVLAQETAKLRDPQVQIVELTVRGDTADATVQASVRGEKPVQDTIRLTREKGRFRIASRGPAPAER
jgi:ketosteroid isomerase-like protein